MTSINNRHRLNKAETLALRLRRSYKKLGLSKWTTLIKKKAMTSSPTNCCIPSTNAYRNIGITSLFDYL
jgi:hypothetical protein